MEKTDVMCKHPACSCPVTDGESYCSQYCKDAGADEIEISCDCGHAGCALTEGRFSSGMPSGASL